MPYYINTYRYHHLGTIIYGRVPNATLGLALGVSGVGADLASENGLLIPAATGDRVIAQSDGNIGNGVLRFLATAKGAVA
jgi:hypothetical protein